MTGLADSNWCKRLTGETAQRPGDDSTRVSINIDSDVRTRLSNLLYRPEMRGVGYSEFVLRAVEAAEAELLPDPNWCKSR